MARTCFALVAAVAFGAGVVWGPSAEALEVNFNWGTGNLTIFDNSLGDTNSTTGIIDFNQSLPGFNVQGTVDTVAGPTLTSIIGTPSAALRLTNFTAEAVGTPAYQLHVQMLNVLTGTFSGLVGGDAIDPYAANAFGSAVPAGQDVLQFWQGFLDLNTFPPAFGGPVPGGNPFVPASSLPVPYPLYGHGPYALSGTFLNPLLGADLYVELGGNGDQLILPTSGNVGIAVAPEPGTFFLLALGLAALVARRTRAQPSV